MDAKKKTSTVIRLLLKEYPEPATALRYRTPFELLVATVLSAQTTDVHVNRVTDGLFRKYSSMKDYAGRPLEEIQKDISSINFYRNKARNIQNSAKMIMEEFNSKVPDSMESLIKLPGVARKTANIILSNAYGINEGIAVDTHVKRLSQRLGLTKQSDPVKIEQDLMKLTPRKQWADISHLLILHGRNICKAKSPRHDKCVLFDICPSNRI